MKKLLAGMFLCAALAGAAGAQAIEEKNLAKHPLKADQGYIFLHAPDRLAGTFIRIPSDEDIAQYNDQRRAAFAEAMKKYAKSLDRWNGDVKWAQERRQKAPPKPVEPTEATFSFPSFAHLNAVVFGPIFAFSKDEERGGYSYLTAVKPGRYVWYGPVFVDEDGARTGLCYCMGSVSFEVRSGVITDLGDFLVTAPRFGEQKTAPLPDIDSGYGLNGIKIRLPEQSREPMFGVPRSLSELPSVRPTFAAAGKMDNIYGVMISRLPRIEGVLDYQRDEVVDVASGNIVADQPFGAGEVTGG